MPSTYIQRTPSGGNRKKWTWSAWIKLSDLTSVDRYLWSAYSAGNNTGYLQAYFHTDQQLTIGAWNVIYLNTTRVFRDPSAWYHIVIVMDTAQATAANRLKLYINGVEETTFDTDNRSSISQDSDMGYNSNGVHTIGGYQSSGSANAGYNGIMSHVHFTDGYAYTPSDFGSTDASTGEWKINTTPSVSYGTTGYFILKDGNGLTDQSPNSNNWTASGNLTKTEDCPSNVFCTINPLFRNRFANTETLSNGNTTMTTGPTDGDKAMLLGTIGVTSGKWYWECKAGADRAQIGFAYNSINRFTDFFGSNNPSDGFSVYALNGQVYYDGNNTAYGSSWTTNDIIMVALDMDNKLAWLGKNGTWFNSATQTEIENGTATNDLTTKMGTKQNLNSGEFVFPMFADSTGTGDIGLMVNFGNGYFGTTAVSSAGTNASNLGIFEYNVPNGFRPLCTKALNL